MFWLPELFTLKKKLGLPQWPVGKTLPSSAVGKGSNSGPGTMFLPVFWPENQNIKQKQYYNKLDKDFIKWSTSCPLKKKERMWQIVSICMTNPKTSNCLLKKKNSLASFKNGN